MPFGRTPKANIPIKGLADIASEEYQDLVNVYFRHNPESPRDGETEVIKVKGFSQYGTAATLPGAKAALGLASFTPSVGTYGSLYGAWDDGTPDTQIYRITGSGDPTSAGATGRFATNGNTIEFEQAFDNQYATNGVDSVLLQTGSTGVWSTPAPGAPYSGANTVAKYLCFHNYMMFAARTQNAPNALYVSDAGAPGTFTGITKTFRYAIIGLKSLSDYLMVYTEKETWAVTGTTPSTLAYRLLPQENPCVSHRSIVTVIGEAREYSATGVQSNVAEHWYLGSNYVWATNGSTFRILGKESWEKYRTNLNSSRLDLAAAVFDNETGQYLLSVPTGANTKNTVTWAYDPLADKWIERPYVYAAVFAKHGTPTPSIYFADANTTGKTYLLNSGNGIQSQKNALNGDITESAQTITVNSTTGFPSTGYIQIENESIRYTGTTATQFTGCIRGAEGTTMAAHTSTTAVYPAMQFCYRTRNMNFDATNLVKKFKILWVNVLPSTTPYNLTVYTDVDQSGFSSAGTIPLTASGMTWGTGVWGSNTWGGSNIILTPDNRVAIPGRGKSIKISLEENTSIAQTEVIEMETELRPVKRK